MFPLSAIEFRGFFKSELFDFLSVVGGDLGKLLQKPLSVLDLHSALSSVR